MGGIRLSLELEERVTCRSTTSITSSRTVRVGLRVPTSVKKLRFTVRCGAHDSTAPKFCVCVLRVLVEVVLHPLGTNPSPRQPREDTGGKEQYHLLHVHESLEGVPPPTAKNHATLNNGERQVVEEEHSPKSELDFLPPLRVGGHVTCRPQPAYGGEQEEDNHPDDCEGKVGAHGGSPIHIFIESNVGGVVRDGQHCSCEPGDDEDDGEDSGLCRCIALKFHSLRESHWLL